MLFACFHTHRSTKLCLMGLEACTDTRTLDVRINISMNSTKSPKQTRITYICLNFYLPYRKLRTKQYHTSLFQTGFTITNFHLREFSPLGSHFGKSSGSYFLSIEMQEWLLYLNGERPKYLNMQAKLTFQ